MKKTIALIVPLALASLASYACSSSSSTAASSGAAATASGTTWSATQADRQQQLQNYLDHNAAERAGFDSAAVGTTGFPYVLFQILGDIGFRDRINGLWSTIGLLPNGLAPESTPAHDPKFPLGFGYSANKNPRTGLRSSNLTCGTCHIGKVDLGNGQFRYLFGAPNTQVNVVDYLNMVNAVAGAFAADTNGYAQKIATVMQTKKSSDFYPDSVGDFAGEQAILSDPVQVANLIKLIVGSIQLNTQMREGLLNRPDGAYKGHGLDFDTVTRGESDAFGLTTMLFMNPKYASLVFGADAPLSPSSTSDPTKSAIQTYLKGRASLTPLPAQYMPTYSSMTDIMSVWNQGAEKFSHWSGDMQAGNFAAAAGSLAVVGGSIGAMDHAAVGNAATFIKNLPPPVYPFPVDTNKANLGQAIYEAKCSSCHDQANIVVSDVGTDMSRSTAFNEYTLLRFDADLSTAACFSNPDCKPRSDELTTMSQLYSCDPQTCSMPQPLLNPMSALLDNRGKGYKSTILTGIWARAPYMHNGSVPTLYHLLRPSQRPATFCRGRIDYDQRYVGFGWDAGGAACPTNSVQFKVANDPNPSSSASPIGFPTSNMGHTYGQELADDDVSNLLEYLKTL